MSGLFGSLSSSISALSAHSLGVETAGRNVANMNNADYARQRVLMADQGVVQTAAGAQSLGLSTQGVEQMRDAMLDAQVVRERAYTSALEAAQSTLAQVEAALGETIDLTTDLDDASSVAAGLGAAMSEFFNAAQGIVARPTDAGERLNLIQQAEVLSARFNVTDERLAQVQTNIDAQVATDVEEVNGLLVSIANLNEQIGRLEINAPGSAVDLRDQRQARLEDLAEFISFETPASAEGAGQIDVVVRDRAGDPVVLVSHTAVENPVSFDGTGLVAGGTSVALTGGTIQGRLAVRDGAVQELRDGLDALARQLAEAVNAAYNPTGTGEDFFQFDATAPAGSLALADGLSAETLVTGAAGAAADASVMSAMAAVAQQDFSEAAGDRIHGSVDEYFAGLVSELGRAVATNEGLLDDQTRIETLVIEQRQAISGVSLDEEMADLLKFQRAFEASSRVVSIIDGLLDNIVNQMGRG